MIVKGLTEEIATSAEKAQMLIEQSRLNRMVGATALNADSSRSHAVYQIKLIKIPKQATKRDIQQVRYWKIGFRLLSYTSRTEPWPIVVFYYVGG